MIEIIDNACQLFVTTGCAIVAGVLSFQRKSQRYFILACFYGTFALGLLFWLLYLVVMTYTPKFFYVSDLSWIASFLFLLMLSSSGVSPEEQASRSLAPWLTVLLLAGLTLLICRWGDYVITLLWCSLLTAGAFFSMRGLIFARRQTGPPRRMQFLHLAILFIIFSEFTLWILSGFFKSATIGNPYFWCDFILTAGLLALLPATLKAVDS